MPEGHVQPGPQHGQVGGAYGDPGGSSSGPSHVMQKPWRSELPALSPEGRPGPFPPPREPDTCWESGSYGNVLRCATFSFVLVTEKRIHFQPPLTLPTFHRADFP